MKNVNQLTYLLRLPTLVLSFLLLGCLTGNAQAPETFNYQGLAVDAQNRALINQDIILNLAITEGQNGAVLFEEEHRVTTSRQGIFNVQIGGGTILTGAIGQIDWQMDRPWISTMVDFGDGNLMDLGSHQLVSVPFALHAKSVENVDDADADPSNELQQLSFSNSTLFLSQGNQVDLTPLEGPWVRTGNGIEFKEGLVRVVNEQEESEVTTDGHWFLVANRAATMEILPESMTFSREDQRWSSNMDAVAVDLNNPMGDERTYVTRDSVTISNSACSTSIMPGTILLEDTTGIRWTRYNKDSLHFLSAPTTLAIPDESTLKGEGLSVDTRLLDASTRVRSTHITTRSGFNNSRLEGNLLTMYSTFQATPRDRVILKPDSLLLNNDSGWLNSLLTSDSKDGGRLGLSGPSGQKIVHLGSNPDTTLQPPLGGVLHLNNGNEKTRVAAQAWEDDGFVDVLGDDVNSGMSSGGVYVNRLDSIAPDVNLVATASLLHYNKEQEAGQLDLYRTEPSAQQRIAVLGSDLSASTSGRLCLFNHDSDFEKVCIRADSLDGGEMVLFGNGSRNVTANGLFNRGSVLVHDSIGFTKAGMTVDEFDRGLLFANEGGVIVRDTNFQDVVVIDTDNMYFNSGNDELALFLGKHILWDNVGVQYLYGRNQNANVYLGYDETEGELGPSGNFGVVQAMDDLGQVRSWMNGQGIIGGQSLVIEDATRSTKIVAGTHPQSGAGVMELIGSNGSTNVQINGALGDLGAVQVFDANSTLKAGMTVDFFTGDGVIFGDIKNFRMSHPEDANKEIWYASLEGPEAGAYHRGNATLVNGEAFVPFPDHFRQVCNPETLTAQLTPRHWDTYGLAVIKISEEGIWVKELKGGQGNFSFDWEVKGTRKGYEDYQPVLTKEEVASKFSNQLIKSK